MKIIRRLLWTLGALAWLGVILLVVFYLRPLWCFNEAMFLRMGLHGFESRSVVVEGHAMHYNALGPADGTVVVLVHGLGGRAEDWRELAPYIARAGYRVYMPDLFGYGRSEQPADFSYSVPDEAAAVVGFLDALGLKQVDLGGWSMGGWIVQRVAGDHPERIRRLMLFDSAGIYEKPAWDTALFTPASAQDLNQLDALLMPHPPRVPAFVARDILREMHKNAWVIHRALATMLTGKDSTDALLPQLKMPVLVAWGAEDHITPLSQGETIHRLVPQSELDVFPACGHLAPGQCTEQMGPKVVDFLRR
jgi:pimeloyl-ACP methyl ester carboxylesterase